jgi:hypothetical protein
MSTEPAGRAFMAEMQSPRRMLSSGKVVAEDFDGFVFMRRS